MRSICCLLYLLPLVAAAQFHEYEAAFERNIPPGLGKEVHMPSGPDNLHNVAGYYIVGRIHSIGTAESFRQAFSLYRYTKDSLEKYKKGDWDYRLREKYLIDSLPDIDFEKQELVIYSGCGQCMTYCDDYEKGHHSCHRNACRNMFRAFIRDKKYDIGKATGDKRNFLDALYQNPPEGTTEVVALSRDYKPDTYKLLGADKRSSYLVQVTEPMYRKIYSWEYEKSPQYLTRIDFSKHELWVRIICQVCLMYCDPNEPGWENIPCHDGECRYDHKWFVKVK